MRQSVAESIGRLTVLCLTASALLGCAGPYSILEPASGFADHIRVLWWFMLGGSVLVAVPLWLAWWWAGRRPPLDLPPSREAGWMRPWLWGGGVTLPAAAIVGLLVGGIPAAQRAMSLEDPAWVVQVSARQWSWVATYPEMPNVREAHRLVVPAGRAIDVHLTTEDVIHAFWVPRLGGKIDAIPGKTQVWRIRADEPGVYQGLCAEYCGVGHPAMRLEVHALDEGDFERWRSQAASVAIESSLEDAHVEH